MSNQEPLALVVNHESALLYMEAVADPVTSTMLRILYSRITWNFAHEQSIPQYPLDLEYLFCLLSQILNRTTLEAVLNNPKCPFPINEEL